jgi:hypothetical protein
LAVGKLQAGSHEQHECGGNARFCHFSFLWMLHDLTLVF